MSVSKKGLGRGFDSLIPSGLYDDFDPTVRQDVKVSEQMSLPVSAIRANPDQPRQTFDEEAIAELADSVREHGILQPLIVVKDGSGYKIVAGERRFRAASKAGLSEVPVIVRTMSGQHKLEVSLIENIQRRDLNAVETATAYAKLRDQFNLTSEQIANRVNKSPSAVINTMRLLKLSKPVLVAVAEGQLTEGQVRPLIGQPEELIIEILPRVIAENWSARKVEQYISSVKNGQKSNEQYAVQIPIYEPEAQEFAARFEAKVSVKANANGTGKIVIPFSDADDFERIKKLLG